MGLTTLFDPLPKFSTIFHSSINIEKCTKCIVNMRAESHGTQQITLFLGDAAFHVIGKNLTLSFHSAHIWLRRNEKKYKSFIQTHIRFPVNCARTVEQRFRIATPNVCESKFGLNMWAMTHRRFRIVHFYPFTLNAAALLIVFLLIFFDSASLYYCYYVLCFTHSDFFETYLRNERGKKCDRFGNFWCEPRKRSEKRTDAYRDTVTRESRRMKIERIWVSSARNNIFFCFLVVRCWKWKDND